MKQKGTKVLIILIALILIIGTVIIATKGLAFEMKYKDGKQVERNIFEDNGNFIKTCNYKIAAAPLGAALNLIEQFIDTI